jgi:putative inorganic carbon (hco3(-)) transporter
MSPFYNDHTSYGAIIAMFIPVLTGFLFLKKENRSFEIINFFLLIVFLFALVFSYSRAAWISIAAVFGIFIIIKLKINRYILIFSGIILTFLFFIFQFQIMDSMKKNRQDSSGDIEKHLSSVTNIATDASNLERINRWNSAFKMFEERPVFGFGPGTYMFQYAPYQMSYDRTIISTDFGDVGNAHSEYIGPLAESGFLGTLTYVLIIIMTIIRGIKVYYRSKDHNLKIIIISLLMGLITYYIHGFLNNFLNTDKASVPFWGFTAIIVAIDLFHEPKPTLKKHTDL